MEKNIDKDFLSAKHRRLLNSAFLLKLFSWFTLILGVIRSAVFFYDYILQSGILSYIKTFTSFNFDLFMMVSRPFLENLAILVTAIIMWCIMQGIATALKMVVETDLNYRSEKSSIDERLESIELEEAALLDGVEAIDEESMVEVEDAEFYKPGEVLKLTRWLDKGMWLAIYITLGLELFSIPSFYRIVNSLLASELSQPLVILITILATTVLVLATALVQYLPIRAFNQFLPILMEIEHNSRQA